MSDKFSDSMEVVRVGDLKPSSIVGECCDCCWNNTRAMPGVLIDGVTPEAAKMLYRKCEVVPAGTTAEIKRLREINADLLEAATHCCLLACDGGGWCHSGQSVVKDGKCKVAESEGCFIWDAIQKATPMHNPPSRR